MDNFTKVPVVNCKRNNCICCVIAVVLTILSSFLPCYAEAQKIIKIGVILPFTGAFARYGNMNQQAISKFANEKIRFVFEDEACDPEQAIKAYKKLSDVDNIKLFVGPWCGSPQSAVAPQLKMHNQLSVLGSSAPAAVYKDSAERMFSTQHSIEDESIFMAKQVALRGAKSVVIVFRENQFSRAHEAAFRANFPGKVIETYTYNSDDVFDLRTISLRIKLEKPDAIYVPDAWPLMTGFLKELVAFGINNTPVYSVYSAQSDDVLKVVGKQGEGLIYSYPDIGEDNALLYFPSAAAKLLISAIEDCEDDVDCVRSNLIKNNKFDANGVLAGGLILKTIRDGKFTKLLQ